MKDRTVNIPIFESDVLRTVESLPRTPTEAGIIPINLKRRLKYKQTHKTQYVSVEKILKALTTLKAVGNPYYQFVPGFEEFKSKCRDKDTEGFNFLFQNEEGSTSVEPEENRDNRKTVNNDLTLDKGSGMEETIRRCKGDNEDLEPQLTDDEESDKEDEESETNEDLDEKEYRKKDCVKKWQFEYNQSTCFSHNYPEINYKEDTSKEISVAPGEGKLPSNILEEKDWDLKSFPCLHPDGKNSLQSDRVTKLGDQEYFSQRILNKDTRFADNTAYVFAAIAYIEKKQMKWTGKNG